MSTLSAQAAVLFAQIKSIQPITSITDLNNGSEIEIESTRFHYATIDDYGCNSFESKDTVRGCTVPQIWSLLQSAILGNSNIISNITRNIGNVQSKSIELNQGNVVEQPAYFLTEEMKNIVSQIAIVSCEFWERLCMPSMILLECRKALRRMNNWNIIQHDERIVIYCFLSLTIVESAFLTDIDEYLFMHKNLVKYGNNQDQVTDRYKIDTTLTLKKSYLSRKSQACEVASKIYNIAMESTDSCYRSKNMEIPILMKNYFEATKLFITIYSLLCLDTIDTNQAIKLCIRLIDLLAPPIVHQAMNCHLLDFSTAESSSFLPPTDSFTQMNNHNYTSDNNLHNLLPKHLINDVRHAKACLLLARLLNLQNPLFAIKYLTQIETATKNGGLQQYALEAQTLRILYTSFIVDDNSNVDQRLVCDRCSNSWYTLSNHHKLLSLSRNQLYPTVEKLHTSNYSTAN